VHQITVIQSELTFHLEVCTKRQLTGPQTSMGRGHKASRSMENHRRCYHIHRCTLYCKGTWVWRTCSY